ncbi:MAG: DNA-binding protein [Proteobacteria bacterium]|nr:DNA-binding protein [Pseudomonadota bacterium]NBV23404.1 DNA-binding protein [Pseudomonadota bacterium]
MNTATKNKTEHPAVKTTSPADTAPAAVAIPLSERLAFTLQEAALLCGISYVSVWRLVKRGKIKTCGALRHKLVSRAELEKFLTTTQGAA